MFITHREDSMKQLHAKVCTEANIQNTPDGYWRYVDHSEKLATTGFKSRNGLIKNEDIIRFDSGTLVRMRERYDGLT